MSKTYLHKQKGKSKHGLYGESFENLPFKVKKYYDRHCGLKDDMLKTSDNKIRLSVYNSGENIPNEDLENIWIKFYKVDKARTRAYGGSGIGLSIVKAITDAHGGKCGVINKEHGVEFWFEISKEAHNN